MIINLCNTLHSWTEFALTNFFILNWIYIQLFYYYIYFPCMREFQITILKLRYDISSNQFMRLVQFGWICCERQTNCYILCSFNAYENFVSLHKDPKIDILSAGSFLKYLCGFSLMFWNLKKILENNQIHLYALIGFFVG